MEHLYKKLNKKYFLTRLRLLVLYISLHFNCLIASWQEFFPSQIRLQDTFFFWNHPYPLSPQLKSQMIGHFVRHFRKLLDSFFGWEVSSAFNRNRGSCWLWISIDVDPTLEDQVFLSFGLQVTLVEFEWFTANIVWISFKRMYGK